MLLKQANISFDIDMDVIKSSVDAKTGDWVVEGYATTNDVDLVGDVISAEAIKASEGDLLERPTLLYNHHVDNEIGKIISSKYTNAGLWVKALISKTVPDVWTKITEGVLNKFSIRAKILDAVKKFDSRVGKTVNFVKSMKLVELSLVSVPINSQAKTMKYYVQKALEDFEMDGNKVSDSALDEVLNKMEDAGLIPGTKKGVEDEAAAEADKKAKEEADKKAKEEADKKAKESEVANAEVEKAVKKAKDKADKKAEEETPVEDGPMKPCPHYKTEKCPVKNYPEPGDVPAEVEGCSFVDEFSCPYLKAAKAKKDEQKAASMVVLKDSIREIVKTVVKEEFEKVKSEMSGDLSKSVTDLDSLKSKMDTESVQLNSELKSVKDKLTLIEEAITKRKSVENPANKSQDGNFWGGCLPY